MAGYATRTRFAGHANRGNGTTHALRSKPDHPIGAGQSRSGRVAEFNPDLTRTVGGCPGAPNPIPQAYCNLLSLGSELVIAADPDGDGVDGIYNVAGYLSSHSAPGSSFVIESSDFFGDGKDRLLVVKDGEHEPKLLRFDGSAWQANIPSFRDVNGGPIAVSCRPSQKGPRGGCRLGDLNGDGVDDLVQAISAYGCTGPQQSQCGVLTTTYQLFLGTGDRFLKQATQTYGIQLGHADHLALGDLDGDGRDEIFGATGAVSSTWFYLQYGSYPAYAEDRFDLTLFSLRYGSGGPSLNAVHDVALKGGLGLGDFNGDGLADTLYDAVGCSGGGDQQWCSAARNINLSKFTTALPNLLTSVKNQLGGMASFEYKPSTVWQNDFLPHPVPTVTKLSLDDGRGQVAEHTFTYEGGKYDPAARKFLGFRKINETKPLANGETAAPRVETTYRQDLASYGLPELTVYKNGAGAVRKRVAETYQVKLTKPYWVRNTATETTLTENISHILGIERVFDAWGNIAQEKDFGRVDVAGDERWTVRAYAPNTTAFITALPYVESVRPNFDSATNPVKYTAFYYDGAATSSTPPVKGDVTRKIHRVSFDPAHPIQWSNEYFTYDSYGNRLSAVDGVGNRTEWAYDSTYHLYPVTERSPRYFANGSLPADTRHQTTATYDTVCGQPATRTDLNSVVHAYTYDAFCRIYNYSNGTTGHYRWFRYANEGNPANQYFAVYQPLPNNAGSSYVVSFFDGRERVWREQKRGDTTTSPVRLTDSEYDRRGNLARKSHPYFAGETPQFTATTYDWNDRPLVTTNPDGSTRSNAYYLMAALTNTDSVPLSYVQTRDELDRLVNTHTSTWGDVIRVMRIMEDGSGRGEYRSYDMFKRLTKVIDHGGAQWTYSYDLLGNRLTVSDPDLGNWSYAYDAANRLIRQTDARGIVTEMFYDQLGRLLERHVTSPALPDPVLVTNTYDEARTGYFNVGQLTTSQNSAALHKFDYRASGNIVRRQSWIDGKSHVSTTIEDKSHKPIWTSYWPHTLDIGSASTPWTYTANGDLQSIPGYITSIGYEADGQTRRIAYANGVVTEFGYSPTRRWLTQLATTQPDGTELLDNSYTRDLAGRITAIAAVLPNDNWILSGLALGFFQQLAAINRVRADTAVEVELSALARHLEATIAGAMPLPLVDKEGQQRIILRGDATSIRFTSTVALGVFSSGLREVEIGLRRTGERQELVETFRLRRIGAGEGPASSVVVLIEEVNSLRLSYLHQAPDGSELEWQPNWALEGMLPFAVRIEARVIRDGSTYILSAIARLPLAATTGQGNDVEEP